MTSLPALLIHDGSVAASVAAWALREQGDGKASHAIWAYARGDHHADAIRDRVTRQGETLGFEVFVGGGAQLDGLSLIDLSPEQETTAVLAACRLAVAEGKARVVWPACAPERDETSTGRAATIMQRGFLAANLVALDTGRPVAVETPLLDCSNQQLADLVYDLGVPPELLTVPEQPDADEALESWTTLIPELASQIVVRSGFQSAKQAQ